MLIQDTRLLDRYTNTDTDTAIDTDTGCSAGIIRWWLLGVRWLPVAALDENPKGVLDSRES